MHRPQRFYLWFPALLFILLAIFYISLGTFLLVTLQCFLSKFYICFLLYLWLVGMDAVELMHVALSISQHVFCAGTDIQFFDANERFGSISFNECAERM